MGWVQRTVWLTVISLSVFWYIQSVLQLQTMFWIYCLCINKIKTKKILYEAVSHQPVFCIITLLLTFHYAFQKVTIRLHVHWDKFRLFNSHLGIPVRCKCIRILVRRTEDAREFARSESRIKASAGIVGVLCKVKSFPQFVLSLHSSLALTCVLDPGIIPVCFCGTGGWGNQIQPCLKGWQLTEESAEEGKSHVFNPSDWSWFAMWYHRLISKWTRHIYFLTHALFK